MSKLLFNRPPLLIDPELACLIGGWEAMILQQIHYWLEKNREDGRNFKDGFFWTFNTYEGWQRQFPFLGIKKIKSAILSLENQGLLVSDNFNSLKIDRTKWYRIDYDALDELDAPKSLMLVSGNGEPQKGRSTASKGSYVATTPSKGDYDPNSMYIAGRAARARERQLARNETDDLLS